MVKWKDILHPLPEPIAENCTIRQAIHYRKQSQSRILFVSDRQNILGYIDEDDLLEQVERASSLEQTITYRTNILVVYEDTPVEFYHNVSVILGKDRIGNFLGFTTIEKVKHEVAQMQLQQMKQIFGSAGIGIVTTDQHFRITFLNEKAEEIFGVSQDVLLYRNYKALLSTQKQMDSVLAGKQLVSVPSSFNSKYIIGNFSPLYRNGEIVGVVHLFYLRQHLEEAVRELEFVRHLNEELQAIYASTNEQIVVVNEQGIIIRLSGTFSSEFWSAYGPEEIMGQSVYQLEQKGIFPTDILKECYKQKQKVMHVQTTKRGRKIWAVAVPVWQRKRIEKIVVVLRDITELNEYQRDYDFGDYEAEIEQVENKPLIYRSKVMENVVEQVKQIAQVNSTALLLGESGVGKEVFAQTIHAHSQRNDKPFVRVNCGAIPENLIESELFGYEAGSFTGADRKGRVGLFELAHEGTIFLDEVGELPLHLQVKLLRVLQEKEIRRVGGTKNIFVDVRIIAATNKDLKQMVREKTFREDLYYRLHVIPLHIPPLRNRSVDIVPLALHFLEQFNTMYAKDRQLSREAVEVLENYPWPGNIRELQNVMERLVVTAKSDFIEGTDVLRTLYEGSLQAEHLHESVIQDVIPLKEAVEQVEAELISLSLQKYKTAAEAARALEISEPTMSRKLKKYFPFRKE